MKINNIKIIRDKIINYKSKKAFLIKWPSYFFILVLIFCQLFLSNKSYSALRIIENKGQWDKQVFAECDITHGKVWFTKTGILYQNYNGKSIFDKFHQHNDTITGYEFDHIYLDFIHSNKINSINKETPSKCYYNYFQGNDSTKWATKCHSYQKITYPNLWDGIDFIIEPDGDALKYSFRVKKGANSNLIKLTSNKSAEQFYLSNNKVHLKSKFIDLTEDKPFTFYEGFKDSKFIQSKFKLENGILSFELGNYNQDKDIIIDPTLIFGTYSGSTADNFGYTGTYDHSGHAYSGGSVYATGFPATRGQTTGFQTFYAGGPAIYSGYDYGIDAGILKYSEDGTQLLWASYLGGKGNDQPHSMIADRNGNLLVYGTTSSTDFPGAVDKSSGGYDIYITRISGDGIKVIKTRLLGGASNDGINALDPYSRNSSSPLTNNYGDPFRGEIIIDSFGKVWISSCTQNSIGSTIPQKKNWKIGTYGGDFDAYFASFSEDLSTLEFATVFGGTANDAGYGINLDVSGNVFFSGGTQGFNLITNKPIEKNSYNGGIADGFLIKMDRTTYNPLAIRYVGTSNYDQAYFVQIDNRQRIYTTGQTMGDFPVKGNVYTQKGGHQFIAAFDNNLSNLEFSTVFGQNTQQLNLSPSAFLVDLCGRICLSGWGGGANIGYTPINGTTLNLPTTQDAFQSRTDGADFYLAVFSPELTKLTYATYYGGKRSEEHVDGGTSRFDRDGKVYQSVCGGCGGFNDFPSTPNAWSRTNNGKRPYDPLEGGCNNAIFKMDLNSSNFAPALNDTT